jgi:hypothetical protein
VSKAAIALGKIEKRQVCKCENCGNEAEMVITCTLPEVKGPDAGEPKVKNPPQSKRVKGTGICTHCGNEADIWLDL